jgi:hypothetical protein
VRNRVVSKRDTSWNGMRGDDRAFWGLRDTVLFPEKSE